VERRAFDRFVELLVEKTRKLQLGDPIERGTFVGPVIDRKAVARFAEAVEEVRAKGGDVLIGGSSVGEGDLGRGTFVEPTVVTVPFDSWVWSRELFVPLVVVGPVDSVEEGIRRANDTEYGLTAGFYSMDESEINRFFDSIEAGVTYVNRRAGATTGAWPNIQSFGGWKASGTSGTGGGGPWYLLQYLREQSRTRVR
jgi:1-pyrroline-5-carboxylate dehydrogenase